MPMGPKAKYLFHYKIVFLSLVIWSDADSMCKIMLNHDISHFRAEFVKLEGDAIDQVRSECLEHILGSFKYHGFLDHKRN